jgi:hypothetical protein
MRRAGVVTLAALFVIGLGGPATAKDFLTPVKASITGPGLIEPIVLRDPDGPWGTGHAGARLRLLADQALFGKRVGTSEAPAEVLGPRYSIAWTLKDFFGNKPTLRVRQDLYPHARGGPVLRVHPHEGPGRLPAGWVKGHPVLPTNLRAWGLPATAEEQGASDSQDRFGVLLVIGLVVAGSLAGVGYALRRERHPVDSLTA